MARTEEFGREASSNALDLVRWVRVLFPEHEVLLQQEDDEAERWEVTFANDQMDGPAHLIDAGEEVEVWGYRGGGCEFVEAVATGDWQALFAVVSELDEEEE